MIFNFLCQRALETKNISVYPKQLDKILSEHNINDNAFTDSLDILEDENFIDCERAESGTVIFLDITLSGFDKYINTDNPEFNKILNDVISLVVNEKIRDNETIANKLEVNQILVNHSLKLLENNVLLELSFAEGNLIFIMNVSVKLKRMLEN